MIAGQGMKARAVSGAGGQKNRPMSDCALPVLVPGVVTPAEAKRLLMLAEQFGCWPEPALYQSRGLALAARPRIRSGGPRAPAEGRMTGETRARP